MGRGDEIVLFRGRHWFRGAYEDYRTGFAAAKKAVTATEQGDVDAFLECVDIIETVPEKGWALLLSRLAKVETPPSDEIRQALMIVLAEYGGEIRLWFSDDLAIVHVLRAFFPPYRGESLVVYRGDWTENRRRRTYGHSWSLEREIGAAFAQGRWRNFPGGSVLLEVEAPPRSIIQVVDAGRWTSEQEVWIDRRYIGKVRVLERYPCPPEIQGESERLRAVFARGLHNEARDDR